MQEELKSYKIIEEPGGVAVEYQELPGRWFVCLFVGKRSLNQCPRCITASDKVETQVAMELVRSKNTPSQSQSRIEKYNFLPCFFNCICLLKLIMSTNGQLYALANNFIASLMSVVSSSNQAEKDDLCLLHSCLLTIAERECGQFVFGLPDSVVQESH